MSADDTTDSSVNASGQTVYFVRVKNAWGQSSKGVAASPEVGRELADEKVHECVESMNDVDSPGDYEWQESPIESGVWRPADSVDDWEICVEKMPVVNASMEVSQ